MKHSTATLVTPIYFKTGPEMAWPENESVFYVLSRDGLFLCRNHPFFRSSVSAPAWPSELCSHDELLALSHPKVPRRLFELVVCFFDRIAELHGAEAAVLVLFEKSSKRVKLLIPEQVATVDITRSGHRYPIGIHYETAPTSAGDAVVIGDIHSHVDGAAYASATDQRDEAYRPGLHVVIGRINREPPEVHCEFVVDGARFRVEENQVIEGYVRRRLGIPRSWIDRVRLKKYAWGPSSYDSDRDRRAGSTWGQSGDGHRGGSGSSFTEGAIRDDRPH